MKKRWNFSYYCSEGFRSIFVNGFMSFAAISIIVACLLITSSVSLIAINIDIEIDELLSNTQTAVYIDETLSRAEALALESKLKAIDNIDEVEFVSREQAFEEYKEQLGDNAGVLDGLEDDNPLRDGYLITMHDLELIEETIAEIGLIDEIKNIRDDQSTASKLLQIQNVFEMISIALVVALGLISVFIISNTVKLAMIARRDEIAIMKMVGATNWFIRWPFIIEGIILGLVAAYISFFAQWAVYINTIAAISDAIGTISVLHFMDFALELAIVFVIASIVIGVLGSVLTIRKFLDV